MRCAPNNLKKIEKASYRMVVQTHTENFNILAELELQSILLSSIYLFSIYLIFFFFCVQVSDQKTSSVSLHHNNQKPPQSTTSTNSTMDGRHCEGRYCGPYQPPYHHPVESGWQWLSHNWDQFLVPSVVPVVVLQLATMVLVLYLLSELFSVLFLSFFF